MNDLVLGELRTNPNEAKQPFTSETKEWLPELDTTLPIVGEEISGFKAWINWNGFREFEGSVREHFGFDFAAYLTEQNTIILGLPPETNIRAVADGRVKLLGKKGHPYTSWINISHGNEGLDSEYHHIIPLVEEGKVVKKGDVIAKLWKDPGETEGRLVHLHLSLYNAWRPGKGFNPADRIQHAVDPSVLGKVIDQYKAVPQLSSRFDVSQLPGAIVQYANFKNLRFE